MTGSINMLSLMRRIGTPAFTVLAGVLIVSASVLLVSFLDVLLKGEVFWRDQLIGALVAFAIGPIVVFQLVVLTRQLDRAQAEVHRANRRLSAESEALRALAEKLKRANQNLDFAQRVARVGYYQIDLTSGRFDCSPEFDRIFGLQLTELRDLERWQEWVHPDDRGRFREYLQHCLDGEQALALDVRLVTDCDAEARFVYVYGIVSPGTTRSAARLTGIVQEITERKRGENELREMRDRLQLATDAAEFGVWDWDTMTGEVSVTPRASAIFAWNLPEKVEQSCYLEQWRERIHPEDRALCERTLRDALDSDATAYSESYRILLPGAQVRFIEAHAYIRRDAEGRPSRVVGLLQDRTVLKEAEIELAEARDRAEASNRAKSEFVANMSHEIRTPLNAVMGMTHLLQQTSPTEEQADYLDKINAAGRSLLGVLNDILDFSKIEAGRLEVCSAEFDVGELLTELASLLSVNIGHKPVELLIGMADEVPHYAVGDMLRLRQILINLAGNAVKFTERGEVTVWVEVDHREEERDWLRFSVCDTGIGMNSEQIERLFAPFTQADASMTRRFGGTGLGLAISKRLVELMGGTIGVESRPGVGSDFSFLVPLGRASEGERRDPAAPDLRDLSVLIVDDHPTARLFLHNAVERLKWRADLAESGMDAVAAFRERLLSGSPYDVVLVDWKMPGKDGIETISDIKRIAGDAAPPIAILVTAHGFDEIGRRDKAQAVDGVLIKPVTCQSLHKLVADRQRLRTRSESAVPEPVREARDSETLRGRRLLLVEDNPVNQTVALRILQRYGALVELAEDGQQAIDRLADPEQPPVDVVLMDVQMPGMDGLTATRMIRERLRLAVPVVAMSAGVMTSEKQRCLDSGMDDFIGKPFNVPEIIDLIRRYCGSAPPAESASEAAPASVVPNPAERPNEGDLAVPGFDLVATLRRFADDRDLLRTSLMLFAREFQDLSSRLERLSAADDTRELKYLVHKFRGSAANLGAVELTALAEATESALDAGSPFQGSLEFLVAVWNRVQPCLLEAIASNPESAAGSHAG